MNETALLAFAFLFVGGTAWWSGFRIGRALGLLEGDSDGR